MNIRLTARFAAALALLAPWLTAAAVDFTLPVSGLTVTADVSGTWRAEASSDASPPVDVLSRDAPGQPALSIAVAPVAAGESCANALNRLVTRGGLSLFDGPAYLSARWQKKITDETDFKTGTAVQSACADGRAGAVVAVVSYGGDVAELGAATGEVGRLLDAVLDAADAAGDARRAYAASGPLQPPTSSAGARIRLMADPGAASAAIASVAGDVALPAGTGVLVRIEQKLSSKSNKTGDAIGAVVAADVVYDNAVVIAKGTAVTGRVAEVVAPGLGGSGGTLKMEFTAVKAVDGQSVPLKYESEKQGEKTKALSVKGYLTGWGLFSKGENVEIAAGSTVEAKTTTARTVKVGAAR